jgi:hypothetical protein
VPHRLIPTDLQLDLGSIVAHCLETPFDAVTGRDDEVEPLLGSLRRLAEKRQYVTLRFPLKTLNLESQVGCSEGKTGQGKREDQKIARRG